MELQDAIRSMGTCRYYRDEPVPDTLLARVLDAARFAPSGGNRQPERFDAVRDAAKKRRLRELYLPIWEPYAAAATGGELRVDALPSVLRAADEFARALDRVPVIVVVCAKLDDVHPTDHRLGRLSVVGGASIYPAVQNLLLSCRENGLGAALTTLLCAVEPEVKKLLEIPEEFSTCAHVAIGFPAKPFPKRLRRAPLTEIAFLDTFGAPLPGAEEAS